MLFQAILDFDNKLKEGTEYFSDISKWVQFYKAGAVQPTYLLKREKFQQLC